MNLVEFQNLASGIQSIIISIAVIIGGIWALITFFKLKTVEKANADLEKVIDEISKRSPIKIRLSTDQYINKDNHFVSVDLIVENIGTQTELINWTESKIEAVKIEASGSEYIELGEPIMLKNVYHFMNIISSSIDSGNIERFPFTFSVSDPGLYVINAFLGG